MMDESRLNLDFARHGFMVSHRLMQEIIEKAPSQTIHKSSEEFREWLELGMHYLRVERREDEVYVRFPDGDAFTVRTRNIWGPLFAEYHLHLTVSGEVEFHLYSELFHYGSSTTHMERLVAQFFEAPLVYKSGIKAYCLPYFTGQVSLNMRCGEDKNPRWRYLCLPDEVEDFLTPLLKDLESVRDESQRMTHESSGG